VHATSEQPGPVVAYDGRMAARENRNVCCPSAASGAASTAPSPVTNARRFIRARCYRSVRRPRIARHVARRSPKTPAVANARRFVPYSPPRAPGKDWPLLAGARMWDGVALWSPIWDWRRLLQTRFALAPYHSRHRHQKSISAARALDSAATSASKRSRPNSLSTKWTLMVVRFASTSDASICGVRRG